MTLLLGRNSKRHCEMFCGISGGDSFLATILVLLFACKTGFRGCMVCLALNEDSKFVQLYWYVHCKIAFSDDTLLALGFYMPHTLFLLLIVHVDIIASFVHQVLLCCALHGISLCLPNS